MNLRKKRLGVSALVTITVLNTKVPYVENKTPYTSDLVKKTDYKSKISDTETNFFGTSDYNKFKSEVLEKKIKEKELVDKSSISDFLKKYDLKAELATLPTKAELKEEQGKNGETLW